MFLHLSYKKICVSVWGDKINESQLNSGNNSKINFDIESREYNSKWYTDVKARKVEIASSGIQESAGKSMDTSDESNDKEDDGLPF